jgi:hypothetical protein
MITGTSIGDYQKFGGVKSSKALKFLDNQFLLIQQNLDLLVLSCNLQ